MTRTLVQALCLGLVSTAAGAPQSPPSEILLPGIVRDFRVDHSDFGLDSSMGYGHVAGNVDLSLAVTGKPTFSGGGYRVTSQWRNAGTDPIAPHLYAGAGVNVVPVVSGPTINNNPTIDSFNSSLGPYGGANVGPTPTFVSGSTMPGVTEPTGLPPLVDEVRYTGNGSSILSNDIHCNKFRIQNNHDVTISGDVTILAEVEFSLENHTSLQILDGSTLTIYVKQKLIFKNNVDVNTISADPGRLIIINLGIETFELDNNIQVYARVISPTAPLHVKNNADFHGTYEGLTLIMENHAGFHLDSPFSLDACGTVFNDTQGAASSDSDAAVTSSSSFDQWFRDELGTNLSVGYTLRFVRDVSGVYEYINEEFYPVDDMLFGNEGGSHNNNFTFEATFSFVYQTCTGQFIEMASADDSYLFLDGGLVIDLGGVLHGQRQIIGLDRLGLVDGNTYQVKFFYANRHAPNAELTVRTNVEIVAPMMTQAITAAFD